MEELRNIIEDELKKTDYHGKIKLSRDESYKSETFSEICVEYNHRKLNFPLCFMEAPIRIQERKKIFEHLLNRVEKRLKKEDMKVGIISFSMDEPRYVNFMRSYSGQGNYLPETVKLGEKKKDFTYHTMDLLVNSGEK